MVQSLATLALVTGATGCSLIYNTGNIPAISQDATIVDAPFDANPSLLVVDDVAPSTILEGQGDGGSRAAILVIHGSNFVAGATVSFTSTPAIQLVPDNAHVVIPASSDYLAVPVSAPVDTAYNTTIAVTVQVTQPVPGGGTVMQELPGKLTWQGLKELDSPPSLTDPSLLEALYSRVLLTGAAPLVFTPGTGKPGVLIRAVSSITIGPITALGGGAVTTTHGLGGPGGCDGAGTGADAPCAGGGHLGGAGVSSVLGGKGGDGGGAGFALMGTAGASGGNSPGLGGSPTGDPTISSYAVNLASGGGGGGTNSGALGGVTGAAGGGGGGTVELTAGGDVTASTIDVSGGVGGTSASSGSAGAGGGGSGGVILVRAGGALVTGALTAHGGAGGRNASGTGAVGRIRWDAPAGSAPTGAMPAAARGPAFVSDTPVSLTDTMVTVIGPAGLTINVHAIDAQGHDHAGPQGVGFSALDGKATFAAPLTRGYNRVCVTLPLGAPSTPEGDKCIDVAYLP